MSQAAEKPSLMRRPGLHRRSIFAKVMLPLLCIVVVATVAMLWFTVQIFRENLDSWMAYETREWQAMLAGSLAREEEILVANARALASSPEVQGSVGGTTSRQDLVTYLLPSKVALGLDAVGVLDPEGNWVARLGLPLGTPGGAVELEVVRDALAMKDAVGIVRGDGLWIAAASPFRSRQGQILGAVLAARQISRDWLRELAPPESEVILWSGDTSVGTLPPAAVQQLGSWWLATAGTTRQDPHAGGAQSAWLNGREYQAASTQLSTREGDPVDVLILVDAGFFTQHAREEIGRIVAVGVLVLAAMMIAALLVLRPILLSMGRLAAAAESISRRERPPKLEAASNDELGQLAAAFNTMSDSLAAAEEEIRVKIAELERTVGELRALQTVTDTALSALDDRELIRNLLARLTDVTGADGASLLLLDEEKQLLQPVARVGVEIDDVPIPVGRGFAGLVASTGKPVAIEDVSVDATVYSPAFRGSGVRSVLAVPLRARDRVLGILHVDSRTPGKFPPRDARLVEVLADRVASAIDRSRLLREVSDAAAIRRLDAMRSQMITTISHELRTPLSPVLGFSELIYSREYPPDQLKDMARLINEGATRLATVVHEIVEFADTGMEAASLDPEPVHLRDAIDRAAATIPAGVLSGRELSVKSPRDLPPVMVSSIHLHRILANLIANAAKYSPPTEEITVAATIEGSLVCVAVSDRGMGIPEQELPHVFEPFYRGMEAERRRIQGTGMGLAVVRQLVELNGGKVRVESVVDEGTTIFFTLPAASPADCSGSDCGTTAG